MALYIVKHEGVLFANEELYRKAVDPHYVKGIVAKRVEGKLLLDQVLFPLTDSQHKSVMRRYAPLIQDFDEAYRRFHVLPPEIIKNRAALEELCPGAVVLKASSVLTNNFFAFGRVRFFKLRDFTPTRGYRYHMLPHLAKVRVCKNWYVAINAVNIVSDAPIIVTM